MLKHHCAVIYDGVNNSVFYSQVLAPLIAQLDTKTFDRVTLVTYERLMCNTSAFNKIIPSRKDLLVVVLKRSPFFGTVSLWLGVNALKKLIKSNNFTSIMARGPLAGWIALKAGVQIPITIQARGLCAEEYRYAEREYCSWWKRPKYNFLYHTYTTIEKTVYGTKIPVTIEVVSNALAQYLIKHFGTTTQSITLATKDIPAPIQSAIVATWRSEIRTRLNIPETSTVYCYSGSYKPWQCADETIKYFIEQYGNNKHALLLILTSDTKLFQAVLHKYALSPSRYHVCKAPANEVLTYLAAADIGFLFRNPDIVNWVSRPTKILEYQAVGLKIIHNGTVEYALSNQEKRYEVFSKNVL